MYASEFVPRRPDKQPSAAAATRPAAGLLHAARFLPSKLTVWVVVQITAGAAALGGVLAAGLIRPEIAMPWPGLSPHAALVVGVAFWLGFGLLGGIRANQRPGGSIMTFSTPFIVAGTVLGGPVAGGLMGLVSEMEIRELRSQPLRGILANHAVSMLGGIIGGLAGEVARLVLAEPLASQKALAFLLVAGVTGLVFALVNLALVIPTLALRADVSLKEASRIIDTSVRTTLLAEGILAWLMAASYLAIGWWAPVVSIVLALAIWQAHNRLEALRHDEKTGLLNDLGFLPRVATAVDRARSGDKRSALLLLDLDHFKAVNDTYLYESGDEVLRATARRLLVSVRASDAVARLNRAGDEFALLLDDVPNLGVALRLATRIQEAIRQPVRLPSFDTEARVDASIGIVMLDEESALSPSEVMKIADARMLRGKALGSGIVALGDLDAGTGDAWRGREQAR